jgi:hypothetical protein
MTESMEARAVVGGKRGSPEQFRQLARGSTTREIHLKKAILRV